MAPTDLRVRGAVALAALCLLAMATGIASAQTTATELDGCTTIEDPGDYVLTADINGSDGACIDIQADDVTLDGDGNAIEGTEGDSGVGVAVGNVSNVTVEDVQATNWSTGVLVENASDVTVANSTATANAGDGVVLNGTTDATVTDSNLSDNGDDGVDISDADGVVLDGNTLTGNGGLPVEVTNSTSVEIRSANAST